MEQRLGAIGQQDCPGSASMGGEGLLQVRCTSADSQSFKVVQRVELAIRTSVPKTGSTT